MYVPIDVHTYLHHSVNSSTRMSKQDLNVDVIFKV